VPDDYTSCDSRFPVQISSVCTRLCHLRICICMHSVRVYCIYAPQSCVRVERVWRIREHFRSGQCRASDFRRHRNVRRRRRRRSAISRWAGARNPYIIYLRIVCAPALYIVYTACTCTRYFIPIWTVK